MMALSHGISCVALLSPATRSTSQFVLFSSISRIGTQGKNFRRSSLISRSNWRGGSSRQQQQVAAVEPTTFAVRGSSSAHSVADKEEISEGNFVDHVQVGDKNAAPSRSPPSQKKDGKSWRQFPGQRNENVTVPAEALMEGAVFKETVPSVQPFGAFANRSSETETSAENLQCDNSEADDNDDQLQVGDVADDVDGVDEEMEEVLVLMRSGLPGNSPVVSNSVCVGIDPDLSGAIAVLKSRDNCTIAEVIDVPCVTVPVNKKMRRRHDYQSIAGIVNQLQAPQGSIAYVEQARPFPKDGKQGWYISGYGYGVWLGTLAAAGFTIVPVQPRVWKAAMGICGKEFTKDDSRALASSMFPVLSAQLRRKKDHGRAEALLLAAFGKGMTVTGVSSLNEPSSPERIQSRNELASLAGILSSEEPPF